MFSWHEYPISRILTAYIVGILYYEAQSEFHLSPQIAISFVGFLLLIFTKNKLLQAHIKGGFILLIFFFLGQYRVLSSEPNSCSNYFGHLLDKIEQPLLAKVKEVPNNEHKRGFTIEVLGVYEDSLFKPTRGKSKLYFSKKNSTPPYKEGDIFLVKSKLTRIQRNTNPHTFDYASFLRKRGVLYQGFVRDQDHHLISKNQLHPVLREANNCRNWAIEVLNDRIANKEIRGVVLAMLLGYKNELSDDVYHSYTQTGIVHILAVSGLHVGILITLLFGFLKLIPDKNITTKVSKTLVIISLLIFYTLLTGAAPAVVRAAIMCSLVLISLYLQEDNNLYNTLAFAALAMLFYKPQMLYFVGFQFSFLALFSIVYFQDKILSIWRPKLLYIDKVYQLFILSLSAQILILPLSLLYFHKTPTLFMFAGLIAIPMASAILYSGILILLCDLSRFDLMADLLGNGITYLVNRFHTCIYFLQSLPGSMIEHIFIPPDITLLSYICILATMGFITIKKKSFVYLSLLSLTLIIMVSSIRVLEKEKQCVITFYDLQKKYAIDFSLGRETYSIVDTAITKKEMDYNILPNRNRLSDGGQVTCLEESMQSSIYWERNFTFLNNKVLFITPKWFEPPKPVCLNIDYLIVSHGSKVPPYLILDYLKPKHIITDRSIPYKQHLKWRKAAQSLQLEYLSVWEKGAIQIHC